MQLPPLPIDEVLPQLISVLEGPARPEGGCAVLVAPTGAGKTTRVPGAIADAAELPDGRVILLEPRRVAARAAARRIAFERGGKLGGEAGYRVRFDRKESSATRILAMTVGVFLRMLQSDPFLDGTVAVIFDEFHERSLEMDLALALLRDVRADARPDLRVVVMSATIDPVTVAAYLGRAPIVRSEGRAYPVDIRHAPVGSGRDDATIPRVVSMALDDTDGDVLVFLPGVGEIQRAIGAIRPIAGDVAILPLHGRLSATAQDRALIAGPMRKIVLATNLAETSVTVPGVTAVVDTGFVRNLHFDRATGLNRLVLERVSRASADQRAGRAGRTAPGVCYRLWPRIEERTMSDVTVPQVRRIDLAGALIQLIDWGVADVEAFGWYEAPDRAAIDYGMRLLERLGAIDKNRLTALGRGIASLSLHPRLGRLLLEGFQCGAGEDAARLAAMLSERPPFVVEAHGDTRGGKGSVGGGAHRRGPHRAATVDSDSDVLDRLDVLVAYQRGGDRDTAYGTIDVGAAERIERAAGQLTRAGEAAATELGQPFGDEPKAHGDPAIATALRNAILAGFPDRVVRRREGDATRGVMIGGRGVVLDRSSHVREAPFFVAVDVDAGSSEARVRQASAIEESWLDPSHITERVETTFDEATARVSAVRRRRYHDLVLRDTPAPLPDAREVTACLVRAAAGRVEEVLGADTEPLRTWLARVRCLAEWVPELELPTFHAAELETVLPTLCDECRSFDDLAEAPIVDGLRGCLTHPQLTALDRGAPERLEVPSGNHLRLVYEVGKPPVLPVRIQEIFGWRETPRIAGGRVTVQLHLLAPNYRAQQVTEDLASFWENTYPVVRRELRGRYPKHAWPENPLEATAERRGVRKPRS